MMIILNFWVFKLSNIDQGIYIHTQYKRNKNFQRFWKKNLGEKKIKAINIVSRTTLCTQKIKFCMQKFFFRKMFVCVWNSICGWKKTKKIFGPDFQNNLKNFLCRHRKNASHTISIYGNCMISIFFKKGKLRFFITRLFYKNQTATETSSYIFSTIFRNCMKIVWQAFSTNLMYGIVW